MCRKAFDSNIQVKIQQAIPRNCKYGAETYDRALQQHAQHLQGCHAHRLSSKAEAVTAGDDKLTKKRSAKMIDQQHQAGGPESTLFEKDNWICVSKI